VEPAPATGVSVMRRTGVTLVEILVVVAVLALLVGLLIPTVQMARESGRRTACVNNLRQFGLALGNHEAARGGSPVGSESRSFPAYRRVTPQHCRWSALAHLAPYFEERALLDGLDRSVPLYIDLRPDAIAPQNKPIVRQTVPLFLCPADRMTAVSPLFGPTNYAGCTGSGADGGTPFDTDGLFGINSRTRLKDVTDGLSKTVAFSESPLGDGPAAGRTPAGIDALTGYGFVFATPLSEAACSRPFYYNFTDLRGFSWANGEYRTTLYNHARRPDSEALDCLAALMTTTDVARMYAGYGWRAARSRHRGGVTVGMADGSVRFVANEVDADVWTAAATIAAGDASTLP